MNAFCEFQEAWDQRFPGCELPQVWVEDITANLMKQRQKLGALKEELEKVEFYVQYLENLVARYVETSSSQTVVIKSEENCKGDYVPFNESHDSHQECPSVVSSHKRVVGCSLNAQNSVVEMSPEYTASNSQTVVIKSEENCEGDYVLFNESYDSHQECPSVVSSHKRVVGCSLNTQNSVVEMSPEYTASNFQTVVIKSEENCEGDYVMFNEPYDSHQECPSVASSHKRVVGCSLNTQNSVVEMSPEYTASNFQKVVIKSEENCEGDYILFNESYDSHQECPSVVSSHKRVAGCSLNTQNSVVEMSPEYTASNFQTVVIKSEENCEDKLVKSVDMPKITASNLTSVDDIKYNCQVLLYDIFAGRKRIKDQEEAKEDSDYEKDDDSDYEKDDDSDYEGEASEISDHEKDDDSDYEMETIRNGKKKTFKKAKKETLPLQKSKRLSFYEKMVEEKRAERIAFMKSMEIDQIKEGISEAISGIKQLKKNPVKKVHLPSSIEPIRRSNRQLNTEINFSENALEELTVKNAFQVSPPSSPFEIPHEFSFEDVLKSKRPCEECVNDLSVQKPKCNEEYISYDKAVFENMTLKNFHVRKVVDWKITSVAWYPSKEDLIVAAGDKFGNLNLWKIQDSETTPYLFSIHDDIISNLQFNSFDPVQLITSSFDGTMLCGDLIKHTFNEMYNFGSHRVTWFDFLSHKRFLVSYWNEVAVFDSRANGKTSEQRHTCSDNLINTVSVHPVNNNIFVTCDSKKKICLWDLRKLQKDPIVEILHHKNTVNSAYFSPVTGNSILTTSLDDSICIFDSTKLTQDIQLTWMMIHNNSYDHRFRATWLPHSDDLFAVGFLDQEEEQRKIQIYDKDLNLYHNMKNDNLKTITSIHCFHPYRSALAVGSKAGYLSVFT